MKIKLENVSSLIALWLAVCIVYTITYDWWYLAPIDTNFFRFMTTTDHINTCLEHILPLLVSFVLTFFLLFFHEQEVGFSEKHFIYIANIFQNFIQFLLYIFFLKTCISLKIVDSLNFILISMLASICFMVGFLSIYAKIKINNYLNQNSQKLLLIINLLILILLIGSTLGLQNVQYSINSPMKEYTIVSQRKNIENAIILKSMQRGLVFIERENNQVKFLAWDNIVQIETTVGIDKSILRSRNTSKKHSIDQTLFPSCNDTTNNIK